MSNNFHTGERYKEFFCVIGTKESNKECDKKRK